MRQTVVKSRVGGGDRQLTLFVNTCGPNLVLAALPHSHSSIRMCLSIRILFICDSIWTFRRDTLFRMTFDLEPLERASWEATPSKIFMCQQKGQSERWCRNYVRVLHSFGENQLYACGTNAFQPSCSWRQVSGPSHVCVAVVATRLGLTCLDCGSNITFASSIVADGKPQRHRV